MSDDMLLHTHHSVIERAETLITERLVVYLKYNFHFVIFYSEHLGFTVLLVKLIYS